MKLFVQIPCLNEEETLPMVIAGIPKHIDGITEIRTVVIDDGSTDRTVDVAVELGVDYIVKQHRTRGLAKAFSKGLETCLFFGADIIVNTDGDNQYRGSDIAELVKPIVDRSADIVVGCRDLDSHKEFSFLKKALQKLGSRVVRRLSETTVSDTTSGFRAFNRTAAISLCLMNTFSYTLETLIQAGRTDLKVVTIPIEVNARTRESRLFKSIPQFVLNQLSVIIKAYIFYSPMAFFGWLAAVSMGLAVLSAIRLGYYLFMVDPSLAKFKAGSGSLLVFSLLTTALLLIAGGLATVLSGLRSMALDVRTSVRNLELRHGITPLDCDFIESSCIVSAGRPETDRILACGRSSKRPEEGPENA